MKTFGTNDVWRFVCDACDATRLGHIKASFTPLALHNGSIRCFNACQLPTSSSPSRCPSTLLFTSLAIWRHVSILMAEVLYATLVTGPLAI